MEQTQQAIQLLIRAFSAPKPAHFMMFDISCCWVRVRGTSIVKIRDFPPLRMRGIFKPMYLCQKSFNETVQQHTFVIKILFNGSETKTMFCTPR